MNEGVTQDEIDAARRMADAVNLHVVVARQADRPGFVTINLEDGRSPDNVLYDTRRDAVRHNGSNPYRFYVKVGKQTMSAREALIVLQQARQAFRMGVVFSEEELITPQLPELLAPYIPRTLAAAGFIPNRAARRRAARQKESRTHSGLIIPN